MGQQPVRFTNVLVLMQDGKTIATVCPDDAIALRNAVGLWERSGPGRTSLIVPMVDRVWKADALLDKKEVIDDGPR